MTPQQFATARDQLGATQAELARALRLLPTNGARTVRRWENGERPIPGPVAVALAHLLAVNITVATGVTYQANELLNKWELPK